MANLTFSQTNLSFGSHPDAYGQGSYFACVMYVCLLTNRHKGLCNHFGLEPRQDAIGRLFAPLLPPKRRRQW